MKQVTITFSTNDTVSNMGTVESIIVDVAEQNGGTRTGSGMGPDGRDISLEFGINSEVKPFLKQLNGAMAKLSYRIPSLKVKSEIKED